jgi:hypothetical protein
MGGACASDVDVAEPLTGESYEQHHASKGVVVLAVRWDRQWRCGGFENAQLRMIAFDKLPSGKAGDEDKPDVLLDDAPLIFTKPRFDTYAFLLEPGEYGLSGVNIKVARSNSDVGFFRAPRSVLIRDGSSEGGSFTVGAGEIVYIGHFHLDCYKQPMLWRYYPDGREAFNEYLQSVRKAYPMLDVSKAQFRLFKTAVFGRDYQLP